MDLPSGKKIIVSSPRLALGFVFAPLTVGILFIISALPYFP